MLGGSPISVAVPPTLDAKICVIKNGTGLSPSISVTAIVIGPTKSTVVTLSRKAERTAGHHFGQTAGGSDCLRI